LAITAAAESTLPKGGPRTHSQWMREDTWALIQQRQIARETGDHDRETTLNGEVKKSARRDKAIWIKERLRESQDGPPREKWSWLRRLRKNFAATVTGVRTPGGRISTMDEVPERLADHLEFTQWAAPDVNGVAEDEDLPRQHIFSGGHSRPGPGHDG
ncbi:MAG: hypothetical protein ACKPKO_48300, partial [Candidatus Fonsibacter sp.]